MLAIAVALGAVLAAVAVAQEGERFTDEDWPTFGRTYDQNRHSPLVEITKENVGQLGRAFSVDFAAIDPSIPLGNETYPLVIDGVIYATTSFNHVFAVDGATGEVLWHFKPSDIDHFRNFGLSPNRGVAYCDGKLFMLTLDMRILALDPRSGELVNEVGIEEAVDGASPTLGYFNTAAPVCYDDVLLVGTSGAYYGIRGFVMAYNAGDLSPAWPSPLWTVPPEGHDWRTTGRFDGGGSVAMPVAVDPESETAYLPVGGPSPVYYPSLRPGPNPKTNSVIAVDVRTGQERWWRQQLAGDQWDYDTFASPLVMTARVGSEQRRVVSVATKEGFVFVYDAATGEPVHERIEILDRIDHPGLVPGEPVTIYPSPLGGVNYATSSYDPATNYEIVAAAETAAVLSQEKSAGDTEEDSMRANLVQGLTSDASPGRTPEGWKDTGSVAAVDLDTGRLAWKTRTPEPERGGVTTTATGLAFVGGGDGVLRALDTSTGRVLWQFQTGHQIAAAPSVYAVAGKQYVAVATGGTFTSSYGGTASRLEVFTLGGDRTQAKPPRLEPERPAPSSTGAPTGFLSLSDIPGTLQLLVVAAPDGRGGTALNGYADGAFRLEVPLGWRVNVTYVGHDREDEHGLLLGREPTDTSPALPDAATSTPRVGTKAGIPEYFSFVASEPGAFVLACAVEGHAAAGEWLRVEVVLPGTAPSLTLGEDTFAILPADGRP